MSSKQPLLQYKSLDDIRARKEELRQSLRQDNQSMKTQWNGLFHQEKSNLPSRRLANIMSTGAFVLDGVILAWKLYNRFHSDNTKSSEQVSLISSLFGGKKKQKRKKRK